MRTTTPDRSETTQPGEPLGPAGSEIFARLATLLRAMLYLAIAVVLVGVAVAYARDGNIPTETVAFRDLPSQLAALQADAILTLAILAILCTPAIALAYLAIAMLKARDRLYALMATAVFATILGSIVVAWLSS